MNKLRLVVLAVVCLVLSPFAEPAYAPDPARIAAQYSTCAGGKANADALVAIAR
jgi:hypothetical protein